MRRAVFWLHLITGVVAGLVILIMSVSGVLLMYQRQITAWADDVAVSAPPNAARLPMEALFEKAQAAGSGSLTAITIDSNPQRPVAASFGRVVHFIDPYTGASLGEGSKTTRAFFQGLIEWHRWLGMDGDNRPIGKAITGACNLGFLFLVISGFYLWWPRKWNWRTLKSITLFDRGLSGRARDWNWHNAIGFWSALPLAILVFTATFFSYSRTTDLLYRAMGSQPPPKPTKPAAATGQGTGKSTPAAAPEVALEGLNGAWARAEQHAPGWRTISLKAPTSASAPLSFTIDRGNGARPDLKGQLTLDRTTGEVEKWETYAGYEPARKIRLWVRWIHTGEAGGFLGQTIAGAASAGGAFLVWTGFALALRRFLKRNKTPDAGPGSGIAPETA